MVQGAIGADFSSDYGSNVNDGIVVEYASTGNASGIGCHVASPTADLIDGVVVNAERDSLAAHAEYSFGKRGGACPCKTGDPLCLAGTSQGKSVSSRVVDGDDS